MQKKLIALAVAGLLSAPAFAQSNVTLYGTLDYGYVSLGSGYERGPDDVKIKGRNALESGVAKANRIGFKGVEDLGNGLKAVFVLENGLAGDIEGTGIFNGTNRQSYAGLAGGFGTVAFGRQYTPQHLFTAAVDPFGKQGLGGAGNFLFQDRRLNNLTAYISPDFGGFKFILGYTFNGLGDEAMENNRDARVWAIAPSFTWNNLFLAANYHNVRFNRDNKMGAPTGSGDKAVSAVNAYDFFASYDFGIAKVGGAVGRRTTKKGAIDYLAKGPVAERDSKITQWMIGATFKITPSDSILTSYGRASENKPLVGQDGKARISQWALGYEHALSKRTALYAQAAFQSHNSAFKDGVGFYTAGDIGPVGGVTASYKPGFNNDNMAAYNAANIKTPYRRAVGIGMRHDF